MTNTYDINKKFMVTLPMDILQTICNEMEDDDPEAEDDEPVSLVVWNTQVAPGISEYLVIMPLRNRRSIQLFSPTLSQ
uniref:Bm7993 n=1 Tax=Brugia malayi TaxID=6279 RepID=A0A1I9GCE2_BRUMA|nr:Bm7993 [Brugia malayi]